MKLNVNAKITLIVTCSKCWSDVELHEIDYDNVYRFDGECKNCMVSLGGDIKVE